MTTEEQVEETGARTPSRREARRRCRRRASQEPKVESLKPLTPACPVILTGWAPVSADLLRPTGAGSRTPLAASPALPTALLDSSIRPRPGRRGAQKGSAIYGSERTWEPFQPPSASFNVIIPLPTPPRKRHSGQKYYGFPPSDGPLLPGGRSRGRRHQDVNLAPHPHVARPGHVHHHLQQPCRAPDRSMGRPLRLDVHVETELLY